MVVTPNTTTLRRPRTLSRGNVKQILKACKYNNWSVSAAGGHKGYVAKPPTGFGQVAFGERMDERAVVAEFLKLGLDVNLRQTAPSKLLVGQPAPSSMFAALAPLLDTIEQKPLIPIPDSVQRAYEISIHAYERMAERNIGIFEIWAALHKPDSIGHDEDDPLLKHYFRGDVEVMVDSKTKRIITVVDLLEHTRTFPRVAFSPEVTPSPPPSAPPEEREMPKPKPFDFTAYPTKSDAARAWFATLPAGKIFTRAEIREAFPGDEHSVENVNWVSTAEVNLARAVKMGTVRRIGVGEYEMVDPDKVTALIGPPRKLSPAQGLGLERSLAVRQGRAPSVYSVVSQAVADAEPGTEFTSGTFRDEHGFSLTVISTALRKLHEDGKLVKLENTNKGAHLYRKPLKRGPKPRTPLFREPSTVDLPDMDHHEDDPEDEGAVYTAKKPRGRQALKPRVADDDYEAEVGFTFVAGLPKSDMFDLVDIVKQHRRELEENPWGWARIATYSGGQATEVASKRAARLEHELNDPSLKFQVRRLSEVEVGLFVSRDPVGDRGHS